MDISFCCWTAKSKSEVDVVEKIVVRRLIIELLYCFLFFFCFFQDKVYSKPVDKHKGPKRGISVLEES